MRRHTDFGAIALIAAMSIVTAACGGSDGEPAASAVPTAEAGRPEESGAPSTTSAEATVPADESGASVAVPVGVWIDQVGRSAPRPDGTTTVVAIQVGTSEPGTSGRVEVSLPADGVDEQTGVIGACAGLPSGDLGGAAIIAVDAGQADAGEGVVGARMLILDELMVPGELHAASLEWATADEIVRSATGEVRLSADARSGTFVGNDDTGLLVSGRFDCFGEGGATAPVVEVRERDLRSIEITADVEGDDWIDGLRLEADETSLTGVDTSRDGAAYCSGVVGLDEPYLVRLESSATSDREGLVSVVLRTDRPAGQRERVEATLVLETDGDRYVFDKAVMELSSDGTGGYFEGVIPGGEVIAVTGFWLCE